MEEERVARDMGGAGFRGAGARPGMQTSSDRLECIAGKGRVQDSEARGGLGGLGEEVASAFVFGGEFEDALEVAAGDIGGLFGDEALGDIKA